MRVEAGPVFAEDWPNEQNSRRKAVREPNRAAAFVLEDAIRSGSASRQESNMADVGEISGVLDADDRSNKA